MSEHGSVTHHGTGNISVGNSGTLSQGDHSPVNAPPGGAAAQGLAPSQSQTGAAAASPDKSRNVFVVHGRDMQVATAMFDLLRALDLVPLEWEQLVAATGHAVPFLGDVVHRAPRQAQAALVLFTPDDVVMLHRDLHGPGEALHETRRTCQPRPNVLIELGMVLAVYPERTVLVEVGGIRPIADIAGRNFIHFDGSQHAVWKLADRLKVAGCAVDDRALRQLSVEAFQGWDAYERHP
ncbi:putative nucleotide-binding protein [Catenulispora sp. MAP12-49]|uniref:TIR domain-containing protein n=1 Tax=unclassified Catenulispora TaxID=414885 RepID=UPI0035115494